jgi:hypothetical protein
MFEFEFLRQIREIEGINTWIQICLWFFALAWAWTFARLLQGGYRDMTEIIFSKYAKSRERLDTAVKLPVRTLALFLASIAGAFSFAFGLFFQGAVLIVIYQQVMGA